MKLFEVLDRHVDWEWTHKTSDQWSAIFSVDDRTAFVTFDMQPNPFGEEFEGDDTVPDEVVIISFITHKTNNYDTSTTEITGTGNEFQIFATVANIVGEFIKSQHPPALVFSAASKEPSRVKLYKRFIKKLERSGYEEIFATSANQMQTWLLVKE